MDFSQISQAASTAKNQQRNIPIKNANFESKGKALWTMDGGSECQDKRDELEMCHRIHNTSLQDTMPQNLPTYSPTHQQSQPPPIIHSTFPPIQGASYMPLDQGLSSPTQEHLKEWLHPYNQS